MLSSMSAAAFVLILPSELTADNAAAIQNAVLGENPAREKLVPLPRQRSAITTQQLATEYKLRVVYMIPSNRRPQTNAESKIQKYVVRMQRWFREQMERLGYGSKTFQYETQADGRRPKVNFAYVDNPDTFFHDQDYGMRWSKILDGIASVGFLPWQSGEVLLVVAETHLQLPDGSFLEGSTFFGGAGGKFTGVGIVTGETLARFSATLLTDDRPYEGLHIPALGPYPLVQDVTFPWFEGSTLSSVSSAAQGAAIHETAHGWGLWHDFRNDDNFNGNLMGNGLRGIRGALHPNRYPQDDTRLSSGSALLLNYHRFFNQEHTFTEDNPPLVNILSTGTIEPFKGLCHIAFSAQDQDSALAGALLIRDGHVVADKPLKGNQVEARLGAYDYQVGLVEDWHVLVFDTQGNSALSPSVNLACAAGYNRAPIPYVRLSKTRASVREKILLDAQRSYDPDGSDSQLWVEWDLDGDKVFDTPPSNTKTFTTTYRAPGVYQVIAKLTDGEGAVSQSIPIGIRIAR